MELPDPNKILGIDKAEFGIPEALRKKMRENHRERNLDIVNQLAFYELNISKYVNESSMCEKYGISQDQLELFKRNHREEIETAKDEHKYGKFKVTKHLGKVMVATDAMMQARLSGDDIVADRIKTVLKEVDSVLPLRDVQKIAEVLKLMDDAPVAPSSAQQININVNSDINKAQEAFDKKMREKRTVDIPNEKEPDREKPI